MPVPFSRDDSSGFIQATCFCFGGAVLAGALGLNICSGLPPRTLAETLPEPPR